MDPKNLNPREFLKTWRDTGHEELAAQVVSETINEEQRMIDVVWFTGVDVPRYDYWSGNSYVLRFDPKGADLSLLNSMAPVLDNHWLSTTDDQKGVVLKAWEKAGQYLATLQFKRSTELTGPRPNVDGLWQDIKDKVVTKLSMGVEILEAVDQRNKDDKLELRTATKWRPFELSLAPIPADFGTTTLNSDSPSSAKHSLSRLSHEVEILRLR